MVSGFVNKTGLHPKGVKCVLTPYPDGADALTD